MQVILMQVISIQAICGEGLRPAIPMGLARRPPDGGGQSESGDR